MGTPHTPRQQSSGWIGLQDLDVEPTPAIRSGLPGARQLLDSLIATSRDYHRASGGHLCVFRDLAGLFVTAAYGVTLNHATSGGPDGWLGQVPAVYLFLHFNSMTLKNIYFGQFWDRLHRNLDRTRIFPK